MDRVFTILKKHFFAGLLIIIPMAVIFFILQYVVSFLWSMRVLVPEAWLPENIFQDAYVAALFNVLFLGVFTLGLALLVSGLGWLSKRYVGRKLLDVISDTIQRIPVIRSIYSALDQLLKTLAAGGGQQFNRVVYVEYPRKGVFALAFVTGPARLEGVAGPHLNLYVPTTPNPTSGFHLIVPESDVRDSHLSVEDAFKTILSLGIARHEQ